MKDDAFHMITQSEVTDVDKKIKCNNIAFHPMGLFPIRESLLF